jgi:hypothetical protein
VIMQWRQHLILDQKYAVQDVIERAVNTPSFYNALSVVALAHTGGIVSNANWGAGSRGFREKSSMVSHCYRTEVHMFIHFGNLLSAEVRVGFGGL